MCKKCSDSVAHLKSPARITLTDEEKASLPGKEWGGPRALLSPEQLEETRIYRRAYERLYREKRKQADGNLHEYQKEYQKSYKRNHPDILKEQSRQQYLKAKERYLENDRRRRAILANAYSEHYTTADVIARWGTNCHLCEEQIDFDAPRIVHSGDSWRRGLHLDHVIPLSAGGPDILENVKPAHAECNLARPKDFSDAEELSKTLDIKVLNLVNVQIENMPRKRGRRFKDF